MKGERIMKPSVVRVSIAALVVALLTLCMLPVTGHNLIPAPQQVNAGGDKADKFVSFLESDGFVVREGAMAQFPMDERCCPDGSELPCSFFNIASRYMVPFVPKLPEQPRFPEYSWYPGNPVTGDPPNPEWSGTWQLRPDEALVLVGTTPPPVRYFGLQSYIFFRYNPGPGVPTEPCPPYCPPFQRFWNNFGDQTNQLTIHTSGTPNGAPGDPFRKLTVYIVTADQTIDARVREAARRAGYPPPIINTEPMPDSLLNLGVGETADSFNLLFRAALALDPEDAQELLDYKATPKFRVFRVTPDTPAPDPPVAADPFPIPEFRAHGTGETEFYLLPAVEELRDAILTTYPGLVAQEFQSDQGPCHFGLYGIEQKVDEIGPSIDSLYLDTGQQDLGTLGPDDFFIVYGVNHQQTGKAMYMNVTMYGKTKQIAANQIPDPDLLGSAEDYLPASYPNIEKLYAYKFARDCGEDENCLEIPYGCPGMAADETAYIIWRNYLEAATKTGADRAEVVLDRAIKFSPED
jgi:hypothetical protein